VTPGLLLGPHPYDFFALTPGVPFALVASPKLGLRQPRSSLEGAWEWND